MKKNFLNSKKLKRGLTFFYVFILVVQMSSLGVLPAVNYASAEEIQTGLQMECEGGESLGIGVNCVDPWDKSSLSFGCSCNVSCDKISAQICNSGDKDMTGPSAYEVWFKASGNPKDGVKVADGTVPALAAGACATLEYVPTVIGNYKFKAYQRPGHPGTGELWSEDCGVTSVDSCGPTCGDGKKESTEQCDDGNKTDGDGCSANCTLENTYVCEDVIKKTGWWSEYYNYSKTHPDMNLDSSLWPDKIHSDPLNTLWNTDWYTNPYFKFNRVDANLNFGDNFFPFDIAPEEIDNGHEYHYGVHWRAQVQVASAGDYAYVLRSDDDSWVYLDGVLVGDNSGIHAPTTINGTMTLDTNKHIVDIFFAERHTTQSALSFNFVDTSLTIIPMPKDCEPTCSENSANWQSLDKADVGNLTSEGYHSISGWSAANIPGNYGGCANGAVCDYRQIVENPCGETERTASIIMQAGTNEITKLKVRHLDGISLNDSFEIWNGATKIADWDDTTQVANEVWLETIFDVAQYNLSGDVTLTFKAVDPIWNQCDTYGQVVIDWVEMWGCGEPWTPKIECGNGILEAGEQCDDGNKADGDGCSANCTIEQTGPRCGDGIKNGTEQCDDGNTNNNDACKNDCTLPSICEFDLDVMMVMDRSGSMGYETPTRLSQAQVAANGFLNELRSGDQSGLVSYADLASLDKTLSNNHAQTQTAISSLISVGATNIGDAIALANSELTSVRINATATQIMILLTDGLANKPNGPGYGEWPADVTYALAKANDAAAAGIKIFTIGLGADTNATMLQQIASTTGGKYYYSPTAQDLDEIFGLLRPAVCEEPVCGDGVKNGSEVCDDGNQSNTDDCLNNCTAPTCGDGYVWAGQELCDDNGNNGQICIPAYNSSCSYCSGACTPVNLNGPYCGDNIKNGTEECDGTDGVDAHHTCSNTCTLVYVPYCGDGLVNQTAEQCDDGNQVDTDSCTNSCISTYCGDGVKNGSEVCDDGNQSNTDDCLNNCTAPTCGDGYVWAGQELCDDNGNNGQICIPAYNSSCSYCSGVCTPVNLNGPYCGDNIKNGPEECDGTDGVDAHHTCSSTCTLVYVPYCGDGIKNGTEECDGTDGVGAHQTCTENCTITNLPYCGDGVKNGAEECDDGNINNEDDCKNDCTKPSVCEFDLDLMLVMDRSGSMGYNSRCDWWQLTCVNKPACTSYNWVFHTDYNVTKSWCTAKNQSNPHASLWTEFSPVSINAAKATANNFLSLLGDGDQSGLVSYANTATLDKTLSNNHSVTQAAVSSLVANGATDIGDAIKLAKGELTSVRINPGADKVMILLTDGMANKPYGPGYGEYAPDVAYALAKADEAAAAGIKIFTIGLGGEINATMLQQIANKTGGEYYYAPTALDLAAIFAQIKPDVCEEEAYCGDGVKNNSEECDGTDGVGSNQTCSNSCTIINLPYCGDGIVNGSEQCDDANTNNEDACKNDCTLSSVCQFNLDVMMVMDRSGSMGYDSPTRLSQAKIAANNFLGDLSVGDQSGLVSYSNTATLNKTLSANHGQTQTAVSSLAALGATNIGDAIKLAKGELVSGRANPTAAKIMILLTDGKANKPNGPGYGEYAADVAYALTKADEAAAAGIKIFTIGLGADINATMLQQIATKTGGKYYFSPTAQDLDDIFDLISAGACQNLVMISNYHLTPNYTSVAMVLPKFNLNLS